MKEACYTKLDDGLRGAGVLDGSPNICFRRGGPVSLKKQCRMVRHVNGGESQLQSEQAFRDILSS
jgi:hypothetical protein